MSSQKTINSAKLNIHFGQEIESEKMKNIKVIQFKYMKCILNRKTIAKKVKLNFQEAKNKEWI